jgi:predicted acetyltransferase
VSELVLRTITDEDDYQSFMSKAYAGFLQDPQKDEIELAGKFTDFDRMLGFHDGHHWVATTGAYAREVVLPGGALVPVAAVTAVTVSPAHRRRGLLTAMMRYQLDDIRARTEALAMLFASEASIYGRFGYGMATESAVLSGQVRELGYRPGVPLGDGSVTEVDAETMLATAPFVYDQAIAARPGMMARPRPWWDHVIYDSEERSKESGKIRLALHHEPDGTASGFAIYRPKMEWTDTGQPNCELHVEEVLATNPAAYARIWRYLLDMDLVRRIKYYGASADEHVRYLLADQRGLQCFMSDGIYVRLVDVPKALALRRYATDIDVVLEVTDEFCPWNTRRYQLRGGLDCAECGATTAPSDIAITARDLGAIYMGGVSLQALVGAGLATELTAGAVRRASTALGWPVAPSMPDDF